MKINLSNRLCLMTESYADLLYRIGISQGVAFEFTEINCEDEDEYEMKGEVHNLLTPPCSEFLVSCEGVRSLYKLCDGGMLAYCILFEILPQSGFIAENSSINDIRNNSEEVRHSLFRVIRVIDGDFIGVRCRDGIWDVCYISIQWSDEENLNEGVSLAVDLEEFFKKLHIANGNFADPLLNTSGVFDEDDFYKELIVVDVSSISQS